MPNPPAPLTPNITTGETTGRLATDRYDFEAHIEGTGFRHKADQIDLFPTVVISAIEYTNVQSAIEKLATIVSPPNIQPATPSVRGILKLNGDLNGSGTNADAPRVSGLQGFPVSPIAPTSNQVLTWNGSTWAPATAANAFIASGDLVGNNISQQVVSLTGSSGTVAIGAANLQYNLGVVSPIIKQATHSVNAGQNLTIQAQTTTATNLKGGDVILLGGGRGSSGFRGGVQVQMDAAAPTIGLQWSEVVLGQRVLSLLNGSSPLSNTNMPANTGDKVIFIADATTIPSSGNPSGGSILYSAGGQLFVKQQDGNQFSIGSIPNPSIWGTSGQQTYSNRSSVQTTTSSQATAFSISFNQAAFINSSIKVDVLFVGKRVGSTDAAQFNMAIGYSTDGSGNPNALGTLTNADPRTFGAASGWTIPDITTSGQTLVVKTGANTATTINWFVVVQLSISQG